MSRTTITISINPSHKPVDVPSLFNGLINAIVLAAGLIIILSGHYGTADRHWAYATAGTILFLCLTQQRDVVNSDRH